MQHAATHNRTCTSFTLTPSLRTHVADLSYTTTTNRACGGWAAPNVSGGATRCLHVGNVPSHLTEEELRAAFERHGRVESLRLVSQRGHRFAFANYVSVDEAIKAKAYLSRQTMWRSAISFARRESFCGAPPPRHMHGTSSGCSSPPLAAAGSAAAVGSAGAAGGAYAGSSGYGSDHSASSSEGRQQWGTTTGRGESPLQQHPLLAHQQQLRAQVVCSSSPSPLPPLHGHHYSQQQQQQQSVAGSSSNGSSSCVVVPTASYGMASPSSLQHSASLSTLVTNSSSGTARVLERAGSLGSLSDSCCYEGDISCGSSDLQQQHPALIASPVLATLTSDHFVPTQAWPAQLHRDWPFVEAVAEQLRQVGGSTTISKLRGLLKGRLGSALTIKSVPLKALLAAYQSLFVLMGNRVALAAACCGPPPAAAMDSSISINMSNNSGSSSSSYINNNMNNNMNSSSSGAGGDPSSSLQQFVVRASA
jgi:RNA recognition motif. (a.k.a. RRM, RBD, or RNP domain)